MKKKICVAVIAIIALLGIMYAEYRYIMYNQAPYRGEGGTIYIEMFGNVDDPVQVLNLELIEDTR